MPEMVTTFMEPHPLTCKGCDLEWNIYSVELERAFGEHEQRCVRRRIGALRKALVVILLLSFTPAAHAGKLLDASLIAVAGGAEIGVTQYTLSRPGMIEAGLGRALSARVVLKAGVGVATWAAMQRARKAGHKDVALAFGLLWIGMNGTEMAINLSQIASDPSRRGSK